ncbi:hypothetical protein FBUS_06007 [Fasciolopsis buskii]|uniref:Uncharacterized protein n=1 Tax=Fasciolopsis buskii TaxID=27845 RepID=A0A8E0VI26_9TREM|nr:hypothetical protein FBUS_06007 [Fasciolopsis buski]
MHSTSSPWLQALSSHDPASTSGYSSMMAFNSVYPTLNPSLSLSTVPIQSTNPVLFPPSGPIPTSSSSVSGTRSDMVSLPPTSSSLIPQLDVISADGYYGFDSVPLISNPVPTTNSWYPMVSSLDSPSPSGAGISNRPSNTVSVHPRSGSGFTNSSIKSVSGTTVVKDDASEAVSWPPENTDSFVNVDNRSRPISPDQFVSDTPPTHLFLSYGTSTAASSTLYDMSDVVGRFDGAPTCPMSSDSCSSNSEYPFGTPLPTGNTIPGFLPSESFTNCEGRFSSASSTWSSPVVLSSLLYDSVVSVHEQNGTKEASDVLGHRNPASSRSTSPPSGVVVGSQTLVPSATIPGPIGTIAVTADSVINGAGDASTHTVGAHSSNVYTTLTTSGSADRVPPLSEDPCSTTTTALKSDDPLGRLKSNTLRFHTSSDSMNVGIYDPYYGVGKFQIFFLFACFSIGL